MSKKYPYDPPLHENLQYGDMLAALVWWRGGITHNFGFRCQPVPGIHHPRSWHHYRHPRTTQELREVALSDTREARRDPEAYGPGIRKRSVRNAYDDIPRGHKRNSKQKETKWKSKTSGS